ncbi:uncharacterized protein LOC116692880 [Etheostoma spectabile]|uniref:uncharacterized protein LOC116692880 n=1 Tax=Etheostoma spectabile TaxID=54343 RepID=UPI0013AF5F71|nr:uncharacterized protein LOC116692880 [Etheostoma spectabile]XP_032377361.1 uncharacterized protein LOC116692880 [Etheostoma spectabile]
MLDTFKVSILILSLTLVLLGATCQASSLGLTVHVVPLDINGGNTVQAHFSVIAPLPCPALSGLCAKGEDCLVYPTSSPFNGTKPNPGWCVRQWQKTVPSNYNATITLGSNTEFYVSMKAGPHLRANSGRLNQPAFVALPPPLRARVNCPHNFRLSVKDLDGDRVRCRFAQPDQGECLNCNLHSFIELDKEKCMLTFTGKAPAGQYFIYLMAEDLIPGPKMSHVTDNKPLSSVPVHLSLTVEESTSSCSDEPVAAGGTPKGDSMRFVLPYQEVRFTTNFFSQLESVLEVAVVGPPGLFRVGFNSLGPLATMTMAWVRSENNLTRLLPICFAVNTMSLQSEPRCVWLYQREMRKLPAGTVLTCEKTEMTLVLPVTSLSNINLAELQLNSPTCPVTYNNTHLTAHVSLTGCGTKTVSSGSELVYTNTLRSVRPYTMVSRQPSLVLPLACRIPGAQVKGSQFEVSMPTEKETFGEFRIWIGIYLPGEGPLGKYTRTPKMRSLPLLKGRLRREAELTSISTNASTSIRGAIGSKIEMLDLQVMSNCSVAQAQMIVSSCIESETEDFAESYPLLKQGCSTSNSTLEVVTDQNNVKVYRLDLSSLNVNGSTMYVQCTVNLCVATMPSQTCPNLCTSSVSQIPSLVGSVFTSSYTIRSGPISTVVTAPAPATTAPTTTTITTTTATTTTVAVPRTTAAQSTTTSHAPEQASAMAAGVILTIIIFLQNIVLY